MAIIKCHECGREISDKAAMCVGCGCPLATVNGANQDQLGPSADSSVNVNNTAQEPQSFEQLIQKEDDSVEQTKDRSNGTKILIAGLIGFVYGLLKGGFWYALAAAFVGMLIGLNNVILFLCVICAMVFFAFHSFLG